MKLVVDVVRSTGVVHHFKAHYDIAHIYKRPLSSSLICSIIFILRATFTGLGTSRSSKPI